MEDDRGLIGVLVEDLVQDIEDDGEKDKAKEDDGDLRSGAQLVEVLGRGSYHLLEEAHGCDG